MTAAHRLFRGVLIGCMGGLALLATTHVGSVSAEGCGGDSNPACPVIDSVLPRGWETGSDPGSLTLTGVSLAYASQVTIEPSGRRLTILQETDASLTVTMPVSLAVGGYRIHVAFGGPLAGLTADSPSFYVSSIVAPAPAPASFAPNPSLVTPAPTAIATVVPTAAPATHGWRAYVLFLGGLVGGGLLCLVVARRTGLWPGREESHPARVATLEQALQRLWEQPDPLAATEASAGAEPVPLGGQGWSVRPQIPRDPGR